MADSNMAGDGGHGALSDIGAPRIWYS